jgi:hypothetical protein
MFMGKFVPVEVIKACGEMEVKFHSFITSTVYGLSGQVHAPAASQPDVRRPRCPLCRGLSVGSTARFGCAIPAAIW